ncbi:MAG: hypothetical protein M1168_01565 [Candidatus Marsarchaeota archaeon]|nr:hypothetical protein [Candidatus Marsarchaeota archaeon]MCL5094651.1 hypothetical protein [Candidatus Marsarchaeota archaeon]
MEKIIIKVTEKPNKDPEKIIKWFCIVFGLSDEEEKNNIETQILKKFIMNAENRNNGITSSDLKFNKPIPKSTVIYHLNRFISSGLIIKKGRKYYLRATNLLKAIEEIEYDINKEFKKMLDIALDFDKLMINYQKKIRKIKKLHN